MKFRTDQGKELYKELNQHMDQHAKRIRATAQLQGDCSFAERAALIASAEVMIMNMRCDMISTVVEIDKQYWSMTAYEYSGSPTGTLQ